MTDPWEQTLAFGLVPDFDRKEAAAPAPARERCVLAEPASFPSEVMCPEGTEHFDFAAACTFAVLSQCEGDDAVVVVDGRIGSQPVALINPFATRGEAPFVEAVRAIASARTSTSAPPSRVRTALSESVKQRAKTVSASVPANPAVGSLAILRRATVEMIGSAAIVHAFDVVFVVDELTVTFLYNRSLFSADTAVDRVEMLGQVASLVASGGPSTTLRSLPTITPNMKERLLREWQPERVPPSEYNRTLWEVFVESAERRCNGHEQTAILEPSSGRSITYQAAVTRARKLARYLHQKHPDAAWGTSATCGIHVPRCLDWYVMMLGIHMAGGAYLSLDPDFPADRLLFSLEDSGAVCLFTLERMNGMLGFRGPTHTIDALWEVVDDIDDSAPFQSPATPETPAYLIYTSGSTGKPKGVCIEHRNAVNFVESERRLFGLDNSHRVLQGFSTSFDASVEEIWLAFATGSTLIVVDKAVMQDVELLGQLVQATRATVLSTVPTLLATIDSTKLSTLEMVIAGGEACNKEVIEAYATGGKRRFVNSYGPTEATVACMADFSTPDRPVTIGRPQPGYFACIVNSRMELLPPGVPGELCMTGPSVARGYINRPELTAEKFTSCPYTSLPKAEYDYDSETAEDPLYNRLYHTGDLTRWNFEGRVEFLGRIDSQVKLRGFRIEVGEIETNLAAFPGVRTAIVHLLKDEGRQYLCGYLLCDDSLKEDFVEHRFRDFLKDKLPNYMVPSRFCTIDAVPRSPAGKLDRKQLKPPPPVVHADEGGEKIPPATDTEHLLHRMWCELFPGQRIGTTDDFFEVGGQSLLAGKLASKIRHKGYSDFGIRLVYSNPTIMAMSAVVDAMPRDDTADGADGAGGDAAPLQLPVRFEPSTLRQVLFALYQLFIFTIASLLQWAFLFVFFFIFYGPLHDSITSWIEGYGVAYIVFFGVCLQLVFMVFQLFMSFVLLPLVKWSLLQRVKPGKHSIWSVYFLRWWTVRTLGNLSGAFLWMGTFFYNVQLSIYGVRMGQSCHILSGFSDADLVELGDDVFVGDNAVFVTSQVIDSVLVLDRVKVGSCVSIGARCSVIGGAVIEDEAVIAPLSLIRENVVVPRGERWQGSPAQKVGYSPSLSSLQSLESDQAPLKSQGGFSPTHAINDDGFGNLDTELLTGSAIRFPTGMRFIIGLLQFVYYFFTQLIISNLIMVVTFGAWCLCDELARRGELQWASLYVLIAPFLTAAIMVYQHLLIIALRWIVFPWRPQPGMYRCDSLLFHRKILFDMLARTSLMYAHPMYSSLFTQYFLRAMGMDVGKRVECSNLYGWTPGLTKLGNECFIADFVGVNPSEVFRGMLKLDYIEVGDRSFVGNGSVLPPGTQIGEKALIGLTSCPALPVGDGKTAIGSPAFEIPRRTSADSVEQDKTFAPSSWLVCRRVVWEIFRCVIPATFITFSAVFSFVIAAAIFYGDERAIFRESSNDRHAVFVALALLFVWGATIISILLTIATKHVIVGKHHVEDNPLWSSGVWRAEFVVDIVTVVGLGGTINFFRGTCFLPWLFRRLGAKIGKRVFLDTLYLTEPDMVAIGDGSCINFNATLQTHLFEDRVMKIDTQHIGSRVTIGSMAVLLYNTDIGEGCTIAPCSLIMKGESLPRSTHWAGIPAQKSGAPSVMRDVANLQVAVRTIPDEPQSPARVANAVESNIDFEQRSRSTSLAAPSGRGTRSSFSGVEAGQGLLNAAAWLAGDRAPSQ